MTILITGGAGFIGSHLCEYLLNQGHFIICLDDLSTSAKENIEHLFLKPKFKFIEHDIINPFKEEIEIDQIYHLASPASPIQYQKNPVKTIKTNVLGTISVLELAKEKKAKMLLASTSEVYGNPLVHPQKENYFGNVNPIGTRSCYDEGKRCAETLCMDYYRQYGVKVKIVRIFNTYGPRMAILDGRVVSNFIIQTLKGKPLTINGDGHQTRSFMYIRDLIQALEKMMAKENFIGPINIGNPEEYTIKELALKIIELTNSKSNIVYNKLPKDDPEKRKPDISLAQEKLDFKPKVSLEEGLKKTISYFQEKFNLL